MIYIPFIGLSVVAILIIGGLVMYSMKRAAAASAATVLPVVAPAPRQAYRTDSNVSGATLPAYMPPSPSPAYIPEDMKRRPSDADQSLH